MPQNVSQHLAGAAERIGVGAASPMRELAVVQTSFEVQRWDGDQTRWITGKYADEWGGLPPHPDFAFTPRHFGTYKVAPYSVTREDNCNAIVQQGWVWLLGGVAGTTMCTKFSATNGRIGVGTSTTAVAWGQTYLQADSGSGSTASYYQLVSGTPAITTSSGPATLVFSAQLRDRRRELRVAGVRHRQRERVRGVPQRPRRRIRPVQPGCLEPGYEGLRTNVDRN